MPTRKNSRAASGSGTIRQRPGGRWEGRYTVGRDPGTGKQKQKSIYGDTQREVRQKLARITADVDNGTYTDPSKLTVGAWLDIWLAEYIGNVKPFTVASYNTQGRVHIKPALGAVKLSALNTHTIQAFYNKLHRGSDGKPGLSPKTVKNIHGVLHKALAQAVKLGYLKYNPSDACALPRWERKEIKPLEEADTVAFLKAVQGHKFELVYIVDLFTGMRQGEILGLQWSAVDFDAGTITISKQLQKEKKKGGQYYLATIKNERTRRIAPAPSIMGLLRKRKVEQAECRLKAGAAWDNSMNLVFTNEIGGHLAHVTVYNNFKRIVAALGIPESRFHDLRHSYAVAALQSGDDVKSVQETLGHHTAAFTLDVYGHVSERMRKESAARMEAYYASVSKL
ncbi:MAG: site-specific integrase [Oscillospiraceae bacterium]|nr:site-specific integrase [Oscillospiraceae bacterium]